MKRPQLKFRVHVEGNWFVRVHVFDDPVAMWRAMEAIHGERRNGEKAVTIYVPGVVERGKVADVMFTWRTARPGVVAHESLHIAYALMTAMGKTFSPDKDEAVAGWVEFFTERILKRLRDAPL